MIKIVKSNKMLFIVTAVVLLCGACLAVLLSGQANAAMAPEQIRTAEQEAAGNEAAAGTPAPSGTANPSVTSGQLSAEGIRMLVMDKEYRRSYIIPTLDSVVIPEADTWNSIEPENFFELKFEAFTKTKQYAQDLFGYEMKDAVINFWYYTDTSKNRNDLVKVAALDDSIVCTLTADTLELINIDYNLIPAGTRPDTGSREYSDISDETQQTAEKIANVFNTTVKSIRASGGGGYQQEYEMWVFNVITANGRFIQFGMVNGELYAVSVYPTEACMRECVYFEADVQRDPSIISLVSPLSFIKGDPGEDDMTMQEARDIYMAFLNAANGAEDYKDPVMTFYIDNSGARENYWHIKGDKMTMDISSKSKWILSLTCDNLWNPENDLTQIGYNAMGGGEYQKYVRNIMSSIYGDDLTKVGVNAVYDYHFCTEDAWMADETVYEFMFKDGALQQIFYYANEECFRSGLIGWKANNEYINTTTGQEFIPQ